VRAFGVVVSEQDADQIERTNDAISRSGLVWHGLSNQLPVAAAPALEAVADAMAGVASTTGPLGIAIRVLFENIGRLASIAGAFAAFMAGRWAAGIAAAALSVRGLATALVLLRGALIRTGIGALIVGAGELVFQFGKLVSGAGSFGAALEVRRGHRRCSWRRGRAGGPRRSAGRDPPTGALSQHPSLGVHRAGPRRDRTYGLGADRRLAQGDKVMWSAMFAGMLARPWARRLAGIGLAAITIILSILNMRRKAERAGRAAEKLDQLERTHATHRDMLDAAARRPRSYDDLLDRLRGVGSEVPPSACPPVVDYSADEQRQVVEEIEALPDGAVIIDWLAN
jgi:hypothetical protein